jgi:hypothetical protein
VLVALLILAVLAVLVVVAQETAVVGPVLLAKEVMVLPALAITEVAEAVRAEPRLAELLGRD